MEINAGLVRKLATSAAIALVVLFCSLVMVNSRFDNAVAVGSAYGSAAVLLVCSMWLWAYWLVYFNRSGKTREFWLCYFLPYLYAFYRTSGVLRSGNRDDA